LSFNSFFAVFLGFFMMGISVGYVLGFYFGLYIGYSTLAYLSTIFLVIGIFFLIYGSMYQVKNGD